MYRPHRVSQGRIPIERFLQRYATRFIDTDQRLLILFYNGVSNMLISVPVRDIGIVSDHGGNAT